MPTATEPRPAASAGRAAAGTAAPQDAVRSGFRVLLATDGSAQAEAGADALRYLALPVGSRAEVLSVAETYSDRLPDYLRESLLAAASENAIRSEVVVARRG